ncbi:SAM-dependent methyltransferase [Rhizorhabdus wittichii DC-6]|nr:SAM-dependent methyltransferase [Rhizorhabdus wittichii DC-6]
MEPSWAAEALFDHVSLQGAIGDPCCGRGTIPTAARARGHETIAADLHDRGYIHLDGVADFLADATLFEGVNNLVFNPPYSYRPRIAEAFVRRALELAANASGPHRIVAALVPLKWLATQVRFDLFVEFPPREVLVFSTRPSMPPGNKIEELGDRAFKGGTIDYCWVVWEIGYRGPTATRWICGPAERVAA